MLLEKLSKEEMCLYEVLTSPIDFPEFFWKDTGGVDPYRVYDYQYEFNVDDPLKTYSNARTCGKTENIIRESCVAPFIDIGEEVLITTPQEINLKPLLEKIIDRLYEVRITREMMHRVVRKPDFLISFHNRTKIFGRIPGVYGNNVHGMHVKKIKVDESQDYSELGWRELRECLNDVPGKQFVIYGVPNGIRNTFYLKSNDPTWGHYIITAMHRHNWSDETRKERINFYGSRKAPEYKRQILAEHGDPENPMFNYEKFMNTVDLGEKDKSTGRYDKYKPTITKDYYYIRILNENIKGFPISYFLRLPSSHKKYNNIFISIDWGFTGHPTEILVWSDEIKEGKNKIRLIARIRGERLSDDYQCSLVEEIYNFYTNVIGLSCDATGRGASLLQILQRDKTMLSVLDGFVFNAKVEVGKDLKTGEVIKRDVKQFSSEVLQKLVEDNEIILPYDDDIISDWLAHRERTLAGGRKEYVCDKKYEDHTLDSARVMAIQRELKRIMGLREIKQKEIALGRLVFDFTGAGAYKGHIDDL